MSVFTAVTRSDEAGNWDSECLSLTFFKFKQHILLFQQKTHLFLLKILKGGDNFVLDALHVQSPSCPSRLMKDL